MYHIITNKSIVRVSSNIYFIFGINLLFFTLLFPLKLSSQTNLFIPADSIQLANMDSIQLANLELVEGLPNVYIDSIIVVLIGDLTSIQDTGWLSLNHPDKNCTCKIKAKDVFLYSNGNYFWSGDVVTQYIGSTVDTNCSVGHLSIMKQDSNYYIGNLSVDDDYYSLYPLGNGMHALAKHVHNFEGEYCESDTTVSFSNPENAINHCKESMVDVRNFPNCPVRVLALYSNNADKHAIDIEGTIEFTFMEVNRVLKSSGITSNQLRIELVDILLYEDFIESSNMRSDMEDLLTDTDIIDLRNDNFADLVMMFTCGKNYTFDGIASTKFGNNSAHFLALVQAAYANYGFTTAHELAHLFGCKHLADIDADFEQAHSFSTGFWIFGNTRVTVMNQNRSKKTISRFSNPFLTYLGEPLGIVDERDNVRMLRLNACITADYVDFPNPTPLYPIIKRESMYGCPCDYISVGADYSSQEVGTFSFKWRTSSDGFNWSEVLSTSSIFMFQFPCIEGEGIFIRLTITDPNNLSASTVAYFEASSNWGEGPCVRSSESLIYNSNFSRKDIIFLFPNPVSNILYIDISQLIDLHPEINSLYVINQIGIPVLNKVYFSDNLSSESKIYEVVWFGRTRI